MTKTNINDGTDAFDRRLQALQRARAPKQEIDAAIAVYERVRTARSIGQACLTDSPTEASVVALTVELGRAAALHSSQGPYSEE